MGNQDNDHAILHGNSFQFPDKIALGQIEIVLFSHSLHCRHQVVDADHLDIVLLDNLLNGFRQCLELIVVRQEVVVIDVRTASIPVIYEGFDIFLKIIPFLIELVLVGPYKRFPSQLQIQPCFEMEICQLTRIDKHASLLVECFCNQL